MTLGSREEKTRHSHYSNSNIYYSNSVILSGIRYSHRLSRRLGRTRFPRQLVSLTSLLAQKLACEKAWRGHYMPFCFTVHEHVRKKHSSRKTWALSTRIRMSGCFRKRIFFSPNTRLPSTRSRRFWYSRIRVDGHIQFQNASCGRIVIFFKVRPIWTQLEPSYKIKTCISSEPALKKTIQYCLTTTWQELARVCWGGQLARVGRKLELDKIQANSSQAGGQTIPNSTWLELDENMSLIKSKPTRAKWVAKRYPTRAKLKTTWLVLGVPFDHGFRQEKTQ